MTRQAFLFLVLLLSQVQAAAQCMPYMGQFNNGVCGGATYTYGPIVTGWTLSSQVAYSWTANLPAGAAIIGPTNGPQLTVSVPNYYSISPCSFTSLFVTGTVYDSANGCTDFNARNIDFPNIWDASITGGIVGGCDSNATHWYEWSYPHSPFSNCEYSASWTISGGVIDTVMTSTTSNFKTDSVRVRWTTSNGQGSLTVNYSYYGIPGSSADLPILCGGHSKTLMLQNVGPQIAGPGAVCDSNTYSYTAVVNGDSIRWTALGAGTVQSGATTSTAQVQWTGPGALVATVYDNYCVYRDTFQVVWGTASMPNLGPDLQRCAGGTVTLIPGAFASYLWSTGATTPSIVVTTDTLVWVDVTDANGCTGRDTVRIEWTPVNQVDLGPDQVQCVGDTLFLSPGNFMTYLWSSGATSPTLAVTSDTLVTVSVTDSNGCASSDTLAITWHALPNPQLGPDQLACDGDTVVLSPGSFASYSWSTGATAPTVTVLATDTVMVTVTDANGCSNSDTVVVEFLPLPTAAFNISGSNLSYVFLDQSVGNISSWIWDFGDGNSSTQPNPAHTYATNGLYVVCLTVSGSCSATVCDTLDLTVGMAGGLSPTWLVYPNPAAEALSVEMLRPGTLVQRLDVFALDGRRTGVGTVLQPGIQRVVLDVSRLPNGYYFLQRTNNGAVEYRKFVVMRPKN